MMRNPLRHNPRQASHRATPGLFARGGHSVLCPRNCPRNCRGPVIGLLQDVDAPELKTRSNMMSRMNTARISHRFWLGAIAAALVELLVKLAIEPGGFVNAATASG